MTDPLTLCAMTVRQADLLGKLRAAAGAGFPAVGITADDYLDARRSGRSDADLRAAAADSGVAVVEVESPWDWAAADDEGVFAAVAALGCRQVNVVQFAAHPADELRRGLDRAARRAAGLGARLAVEFMPFSELRTLADARSLVAGCAEPVGVILDVWHLARTGGTPADLRDLPAGSIASVQLGDVAAEAHPDVRHEARHLRRLPGDGVLDLPAVLGELDRAGHHPRLSVEVWSDELLALPAGEAARRARTAVDAVLAVAR